MTQLDLTNEDIGKKVYEISEEITLVIKTQVIGKNRDEAFDKWLNETSTANVENYDVKDNGTDVINSYFRDYSGGISTKEIGTIQKVDQDEEDSELEVA